MALRPTTKILFVGDMHLGRRPSGLPEDLAGNADLGPAEAWRRVVEAAIEHQVQAVALAGDLVDQDNALFEAFGLLQEGVTRLADAGIRICAVAGNHDTKTLPRLARLIDRFTLLGPGGTWSEIKIPGGHGPDVHLAGWSFPASHHSGSPLETSPAPADPGLVTFGLLHADLNAGASLYAPVNGRDLQALQYAGWFLGHVHKPEPEPVPTDGLPFYLGSVTGLDPSETGSHGPLLVTVDSEGLITRKRIPLAPLRWETQQLPCFDLKNPAENLASWLLTQVQRLGQEMDAELTQVDALGLRLQLTGIHSDPGALEQALDTLKLEHLVTSHRGTTIFIQRVESRVTGTFDLASMAVRNDPPGLLARQILIRSDTDDPVPGVDDPQSAVAEWIHLARQELEAVDRKSAFDLLSGESTTLEDETLRRMLLQAGHRALAGMLTGREDARETR